MTTTVGELRQQAAPWLNRVPAPVARTVDTADRVDWAVWDQISHACTALTWLDTDLTEQYGTPGLVADVWMAAYARDPQLRDVGDTAPAQRSNRAVTAAMLGTPEHDELRAATVGDPYAAAMSVLAQAPALRRMLRELDPSQQQKKAQQAHQAAKAAAENVADAVQDAADAAAEDAGLPDSEGGSGGPDESSEGAGGESSEGTGEQPNEDQTGEQADDGCGDELDQDTGDADGADTAADTDGQGEPDDSPEGTGEQQAEADQVDQAGQTGDEEDQEAELDGLPVPGPELAGAQQALTGAAAADAERDRAEQAVAALGEGDETGEQAMLLVRAAARQACADAAEALDDEAMAMTSWGLGPGETQRLDPDERMELARKLKTGKLKRFAELIGRFRQLSQAQRAHRVEHARSEYVGVTLGDDLTSLIPAELVNLALPALRAEFAVRFAEQRLMIYEQRGDENEGQGAIIVCVDCSSSMAEKDDQSITGEAYAKALALALLDQARNAKPTREFVAILFSSRVDTTIVFRADQPVVLADRIKLAETFSNGGTNFREPLNTAMKLLETEYNRTGRQRADIVFLTDGEALLTEKWLSRWHEQKRKLGFRCFGIQIGPDSDGVEVLEGFCDSVRRVEDLADTHALADVFRAI